MVNLLITSCIQNLSEPNGWITLIIGSLISAIVPFVLYTLKAKLEILVPELNEKEACLKIKIKNNTLFKVAATNLKIEATLREPNENIDDGYFTYHLELDRENFLMLPYNDIRTFSAFKVSTSALDALNLIGHHANNDGKDVLKSLLSEMKQNNNYKVRIRIYSQHEYSGFGKAIESEFIWNKNTNKFDKIISKLNKSK